MPASRPRPAGQAFKLFDKYVHPAGVFQIEYEEFLGYYAKTIKQEGNIKKELKRYGYKGKSFKEKDLIQAILDSDDADAKMFEARPVSRVCALHLRRRGEHHVQQRAHGRRTGVLRLMPPGRTRSWGRSTSGAASASGVL